MQHARGTCAQALRIGHYARLQNRVSLNRATISRGCLQARDTSSSAGPPDGSNPATENAGVKTEEGGEGTPSRVPPRVDWIHQANTEFAKELEKILGAHLPQQHSGSSGPPAPEPTSSRPPPSVRHARLRALGANHIGMAEALASSMFRGGEQTRPRPTVPLALPQAPKVPEYPRPVLTSEQAQLYLKPLYSRGWFVSSGRDVRDPAQRGLTKIGEFKTEKLAQEFMVQVLKTCYKDSFDTKYTVRRRGNCVFFTTHSPETPENSRRITLADVVAALTVEQLCELQGRLGSLVRDAVEPPEHHGLRPIKMGPGGKSHEVPTESVASQEEARAQKRRDGRVRCFRCRGRHHIKDCPEEKGSMTCLACKGLHHVNDCPRRAEFKPSAPCTTCGSEDHWTIDCSGNNPTKPVGTNGLPQLKYRKCYICGARDHSAKDCTHRAEHPPPQPCPVCEQRGHWAFDCPELPNRPKFVIQDCSYCGGMHYTSRCLRLQRARGNFRRQKHAAKTP